MSNAFLLFSTKNDGYSLANLYKTCEGYEDKSILIIIRSDKNWVWKILLSFY